MRQLVLIAEAGGRDRLEALQERLIRLVALFDRLEREVIEPVVVAIVAEGSGALRVVAEIGFVLLLEQCVLRSNTLGDRFEILGEGCLDSGN